MFNVYVYVCSERGVNTLTKSHSRLYQLAFSVFSKKHDLFTCMQEIMHKCPGAEQTLSLTGFDLHGMERAVGKLCHDIPRKLICFIISIYVNCISSFQIILFFNLVYVFFYPTTH